MPAVACSMAAFFCCIWCGPDVAAQRIQPGADDGAALAVTDGCPGKRVDARADGSVALRVAHVMQLPSAARSASASKALQYGVADERTVEA